MKTLLTQFVAKFVLATGLFVLFLGAAHGDTAPFQQVATFSGRGPVLGSIVGPGPDGKDWVYATYGYKFSMDIVGFELGTAVYKTWHNPEAGAKALAVGPDKCIYIGTYFKAHVLKLDPATGQLTDLGSVPGEITAWQLSLGSDHLIYGCTSQGCKLFRVDPAKGV